MTFNKIYTIYWWYYEDLESKESVVIKGKLGPYLEKPTKKEVNKYLFDYLGVKYTDILKSPNMCSISCGKNVCGSWTYDETTIFQNIKQDRDSIIE